METDQDNTRLVDNVRTFDHELSEHTQRIKTIKEQLQEKAESTAEYAVVEQLTAQLKEAKEKLKYKLLNMPGYNDLAEKLADEKDAKRSAELDISDFLLGYFKETGERQIELDPKDAREVILKGRLGKPTQFQTNLFRQEQDGK